MGLNRRNKVDASFSMSSMTDIVFLLLIFFMIVSTLVSPVAIRDMVLPKSPHQTSAKPNTSVSITPDLRFFVETQEVEFRDIEALLQSKLEAEPETYIALHADESVPWAEVGKILEIANRNKFKLILATRER